MSSSAVESSSTKPDVGHVFNYVCRTCYNLDVQLLIKLERVENIENGKIVRPIRDKSSNLLRLSAENGCEACRVVWEGISMHTKRADSMSLVSSRLKWTFHRSHGLEITGSTHSPEMYFSVEFYTRPSLTIFSKFGWAVSDVCESR